MEEDIGFTLNNYHIKLCQTERAPHRLPAEGHAPPMDLPLPSPARGLPMVDDHQQLFK